MEDKIWYLKEINILRNLPDEKRSILGSLCSMTKFGQGEMIYLPGDLRNIYFLKAGSIKLATVSESGEEITKDILQKGEIFGKCFGGEGGIKTEEAIALEDVTVCYLPFEHWQKFLSENLDLNLSIIKWSGFRIRRMERKMESLYFKSATDRIKDTLKDLAERLGKKDTSGDTTISIHLTHEDLAQLTGSSRQNVTSILNQLRKEGFIDYARNKFIVKSSVEDI